MTKISRSAQLIGLVLIVLAATFLTGRSMQSQQSGGSDYVVAAVSQEDGAAVVTRKGMVYFVQPSQQFPSTVDLRLR
jgi:hypothetical protein